MAGSKLLLVRSKRRPTGPWLQGLKIPTKTGYDFGEAVAAGETAGEDWAGIVPGDDTGDDCGPAGAGEVCWVV